MTLQERARETQTDLSAFLPRSVEHTSLAGERGDRELFGDKTPTPTINNLRLLARSTPPVGRSKTNLAFILSVRGIRVLLAAPSLSDGERRSYAFLSLAEKIC